MEYTENQKKAIYDTPQGNILVSASAGSGKTRVLVERILNLVEKKGINIDRLLIVTFTRAAAKELRDRLQKSLREDFSKTYDRKLKRKLLSQIRKVPVADIDTMDAYCQKLLLRYYYILGVDPNFRVLSDETEIQLLKERVWNQVREDLYADDKDNSFFKLTENFSNDRSDDGLTELVFSMDEFADANENPDEWLNSLVTFYNIGNSGLINSRIYKEHIAPELSNAFKRLIRTHKSIIKMAQGVYLTKDIKSFVNQLNIIKQLENQVKRAQDWDQVRDLLNSFSFQILNRIPKNSNEGQKQIHHQISNSNKIMKAQWNDFIENYFLMDENYNLSLIKVSRKLVQKLIKVVKVFRKAYRLEKQHRHLMEFIDIEHAACDILNSSSQQAYQVRKRLQDQYYEILTDEYQDNNRLQDVILDKISKNNNRFMVGDIKQSIYRFRLADPTLFVQKNRRYLSYDNKNELINLSENFRSSRNIDNFINIIFGQIMDNQIGDVRYSGPSKLKFGANYYPKEINSEISLVIYRNKNDQKNKNFSAINYQPDDAENIQAKIVAQKIKNLVNNRETIYDKNLRKMRPISYSDIAVISPTHSNELAFSDVFSQYNIPKEINKANNYFKTTEIQVMMSLLTVIDNPFQDIPLTAVLRSPIVGFDENQLAFLRIKHPEGNYYQAVFDFYNNNRNSNIPDNTLEIYSKLKRFVHQLKHFKNVVQREGLVPLIWEIYEKTGYLDYVGGMPGGLQRQTNLHTLYERAADYEKNGFKGLFQFVQFIRRMKKREKDLNNPKPKAVDNAVQVMTIHGSKGLQFPIVFLNDIGKNFNTEDTKKSYILNSRWGIGINYLNTQNRLIESPLQRQVILDLNKKANLSEEMRKLYVAMTRAEQRLYIIAKTKDNMSDTQGLIRKWQDKTDKNQFLLPLEFRNKAKNYLEWIGPAISRYPEITKKVNTPVISKKFIKNPAKFNIKFYDNENINKFDKQDLNQLSSGEFLSKLKREQTKTYSKFKVPKVKKISHILNFQYPHIMATKTTAYQSVSEIKRLFDDPDIDQLTNYSTLDINKSANTGRYLKEDLEDPQFISQSEMQKPTSAEVGSATHLVLQEINLNHTPSYKNINELIQNLIKQKILSKRVAKLIDISSIMGFYQSKLGKKVLANPKQTYREVPFSLLMSAKDVFEGFENDNQKILIHGIIDGYVKTNGGIYLFDYKTDHLTFNTSIKDILKRYSGQLNLYALALSKIWNRSVDNKYLYLLSENQTIKVN